MKRKIIKIDRELCNGCALCVTACHEGAIVLKEGKAELVRDDYCDGLGDCLPACPTGAISFEHREAPAYDPIAVEAKKVLMQSMREARSACSVTSGGCTSQNIAQESNRSQLRQFPVQIQLVPENAPYFRNAHVLVAADCCAYAYENFHNSFMKNRITLIGCPKLDDVDYSEKLAAILKAHAIRSITVTRMDVPCCSSLAHAVQHAIKKSDKDLPLTVVTITSEGTILNTEEYV
ncbi:MAG: 4Fe-4S dicluster domain-containing protein [Sphaerochaetaceae bacterium]|nr:4Fe-4S dicluster domain-containing protein [Sphaerochaetaceae bacterium]